MCRMMLRCLLVSLLSAPLPAVAQTQRHYSLGGLGDLATRVVGHGDRAITASAPAGDIDGDGRGDLLVRLSARTGIDGDRVLLVYGFDVPGGDVDLDDPSIRKTVVTTGRSPAEIRLQQRGHTAVAGGEDLNGDGRPDILVASSYEAAFLDAALLLIYGGDLPAEVDGTKIGGEVRGAFIVDSEFRLKNRLGRMAALASDLSGDGTAEVIIVDPGYRTTGILKNQGAVFVVLGSRDLPQVIDLAKLGTDEVPGFVISGPEESLIPAASSLGDVDGDGLAELGLSLYPLTRDRPPFSYLVFGRNVWPGSIPVDDIPGIHGIGFEGFVSLAPAGDVDGDRFGDILLSPELPEGSPSSMGVVFYGAERDSLEPTFNYDAIFERRAGTFIEEPYEYGAPPNVGGFTLAGGDDVDGDGGADIFISLPNTTHYYGPATAEHAGMAFLLGSRSRLPGRLPEQLATREIIDRYGVRLDGLQPEENAGLEISLLRNFEGGGVGSLLLTSRNDHCQPPFNKEYGLWLVSGMVLNTGGPPRLEFVLPAQGSRAGGNDVLLLGRGFGKAPAVYFGGAEAKVQNLFGDGVLVVEAPQGLPGAAPIRVETNLGVSAEAHPYRYSTQVTMEVGRGRPRTLTLYHEVPGTFGNTRGVGVGDFNGDSLSDLALVECRREGLIWEVQLIFGNGRREGALNLDAMTAPRKSVLHSPTLIENYYFELADTGDLNADGIDDIVLKADRRPPEDRDEFWVVLGREDFPPDAGLTTFPGVVRFFHGSEPIGLGIAAVVPDMTGDGVNELALSYFENTQGDRSQLHIVKGRREWPAEGIRLDESAELGLGAHFVADVNLTGIAGSAGDFNHDGLPDAYFGGTGLFGEGAVAVIYGHPFLFPGRTVTLRREVLNDVGGFLMTGYSAWGFNEPMSAAFPGDLTGDGFDDFFLRLEPLVGCGLTPFAGEGVILDYSSALAAGIPEPAGSGARTLYSGRDIGVPDFIWGPVGSQPGVLRIHSDRPGEGLGSRAIPAGDFDGDGSDDLLLAATGIQFQGPFPGGACYLIRGGTLKDAGPRLSTWELGDRGIKLVGDGATIFGNFLDARFDWDKDGFDDILIGTYVDESFIVFGGPEKDLPFIRGDSNMDGLVDLTDPIFTLSFLFLGGAAPSCRDALDSNDDGEVNITDPIHNLAYQFLGGAAPPAPFPEAGTDPTADDPLPCRG